MDLGTRRRLRRERLRHEYGTGVEPQEETGVAWVATVLIFVGMTAGIAGHMPIATALDGVYCTPTSCWVLPQALTGWAIAVAPLPLYLRHRNAAICLTALLASFMFTLFITSNQDIPVHANPITGVWVLPLTYFLVSLLFIPFSIGISRLVRPALRFAVVAVQHWLLLAGLVLWLA